MHPAIGAHTRLRIIEVKPLIQQHKPISPAFHILAMFQIVRASPLPKPRKEFQNTLAVFLPLITKLHGNYNFFATSAEEYRWSETGKKQSSPGLINEQATERSKDEPDINGMTHDGKWSNCNQLVICKQLRAEPGRDEVIRAEG